jgi:transcriptional regulator with XRE-family HTH domain
MAAISMDIWDQPDRPVSPFRIRNVKSTGVATDQHKTTTPLGYHLLRVMGEAGYTRVAPFARAAGISGSTMHRVIHGDSGRPDTDTLLRIAYALAKVAPDPDEPEPAVVTEIHQELLAVAGYRIGASTPTRTYDPLALEIDDLLGDGSTLPETDRDLLRTMIDRLISPYRRRGRRRAG